MEILSNTAIQEQLSRRTCFDLGRNNDRLGVIMMLHENPENELRHLFEKILSREKIDEGYYHLQNLMIHVNMSDPEQITKLVVEFILKKIGMIDEVIETSGKFNMEMYDQLWKSYKDFSGQLFYFLSRYQEYTTSKKIKLGKFDHDILSILQVCMFHNNILSKNDYSIINIVSKSIQDINTTNINQLIDYIDSMRACMMMQELVNVDRNKISNAIKVPMENTQIIEMMCLHLHLMLTSLDRKYVPNESREEKNALKKIYKVVTIMASYSSKHVLLVLYRKYMQTRIIDAKYDNLELEIELVKRLSVLLGKDNSQKLIDMIADMINNKKVNQTIHEANINVKSEEYSKLKNISTQILNPVVITKKNWTIFNTSDLELEYPLEIKCYLDIISKCYANIYQNKYLINWQPTLGYAEFDANIGLTNTRIVCNMLQAMALAHFNEHPQTTTTEFANQVKIGRELAEKIMESLFESNLVIYLEADRLEEPVYQVNRNYAGYARIDIRSSFVEAFAISGSEESDEEECAKPVKTLLVSRTKINSSPDEYTINIYCSGGSEEIDLKYPPDEEEISGMSSYKKFLLEKIRDLEIDNPGQDIEWCVKRAVQMWKEHNKEMTVDSDLERDEEDPGSRPSSPIRRVRSEESAQTSPAKRIPCNRSPSPSEEEDPGSRPSSPIRRVRSEESAQTSPAQTSPAKRIPCNRSPSPSDESDRTSPARKSTEHCAKKRMMGI